MGSSRQKLPGASGSSLVESLSIPERSITSILKYGGSTSYTSSVYNIAFEIDGIFTRRQTIDDSRPWQNPCTTVVITAVDEADYGQPYQNIPDVPLGFLRVFVPRLIMSSVGQCSYYNLRQVTLVSK
jgi:hypothetical protein